MLGKRVICQGINMSALCARLPTPVQVEAVPLILGGGDVMAVSCATPSDFTDLLLCEWF